MARDPDPVALRPLAPGPTGRCPLSPYQRGMWSLVQVFPDNPFYNASRVLHFAGPLDIGRFRAAMQAFYDRHAVWRTGFGADEDGPYQQVAERVAFDCPLEDLSDLPAPARQARLVRWLEEPAWEPFDLRIAPLARWRAFRFAADDHRVVFTVHHIILDGGSVQPMLTEIAALYVALERGAEPPAPWPLQYPDFCHWQNRRLAAGEFAESETYWLRQLAGELPVSDLPSDRPRPPLPSYRGGQQRTFLSAELSHGLRHLRSRYDTSIFRLVLAAFQVLLSRLSGQYDVVVGSPVSGRTHPDLAGVLGLFVNLVAMRTDLSGDPGFREVLERVKSVTSDALAHKELPFDTLVQRLRLHWDPACSPVFQTVLVMREPSFTDSYPAGSVVLSQDEAPVIRYSRYDLSLMVAKVGDRLRLTFGYATDLYDATSVLRWAAGLERLLAGAVATPERPVSSLPLLSPSELQAVLCDWSGASPDAWHAPFVPWLRAFEAVAAAYPAAIAVAQEPHAWSYGFLDEVAGRLAARLAACGVGRESLVGVCLGRSPEAVAALLATWKVGCAYLPLDPGYPRERLRFIVEDAQPRVVVADAATRATLAEGPAILLWEGVPAGPPAPPADVEADALAYVIYTSGSTGTPKGVLVSHRGLPGLAANQRERFAIGPGDRALQFASLNFDASIFETVMALGVGATLCLPPRGSENAAGELARVLPRERIHVATLPPSVLQTVPQASLPALHTLICAGEALPEDLAARWGWGRQLFNAYGPTEATVWSTLARHRPGAGKPTLGRPILGTRTYVLDRRLQPVPIAVKGELCLGGPALALGYLGRPGLTAARFVPLPFGAAGERLYRTGDLARLRADGELEFLGRLDHQVKLRGLRIELGEVEAALACQPGVREAVVVARTDRPGETRLVAYFVPSGDLPPTAGVLRQALGERLPAPSVPAAFVALARLPQTANGKIDRKALPRPEDLRAAPRPQDEVPRTPLEKVLAELWQELLGVRSVGLRDDFFELGGHSLSAVNLVHRIGAQLGARLSVAELLRAPTIAGLAAILGRTRRGAIHLPRHTVLLRAGREQEQPLFAVHAFRGAVFPYSRLGQTLPGSFPIYGFEALGLAGEDEPLRAIPEMAARYAAAVRALQPPEPYRLLGWSFGGVVAWELARQLEADGAAVESVLLLDAAPPGQVALDPARVATTARIAETFFHLDPEAFAGLDDEHALTLLLAEAHRGGHLAPGMKREDLGRLLAVIRANAEALREFRLDGRIRADLTLVRAAQGSQVADPGAWLRRTTGRFRVVDVPGTHHELLDPPAVFLLAEALGAMLAPEGAGRRRRAAGPPRPVPGALRPVAGRAGLAPARHRRSGLGDCPLVLGECVQGWLPEHEHFLITSPIDLFSWAEFRPDLGLGEVRVVPSDRSKARSAVARYLEASRLPPGGLLEVHTPIEPGLGFGTSTADIVAAVRAAASSWGRAVAADALARIAIGIEPTDGSMYPGAVAFAHRRGQLLESVGALPPFHAVAVWREHETVDTVIFDERRTSFRYSEEDQRALRQAWSLVRQAVRWQDVSLLGLATTVSAQLNEQFLPKAFFADLHDFAQAIGAEGLIAAHSGTALALLFDPADASFPAKLRETLRFVESLDLASFAEVANGQERRESRWIHRAAGSDDAAAPGPPVER